MEVFLKSVEGMSVKVKIKALSNKLDQVDDEIEIIRGRVNLTFASELLKECMPPLIAARSTAAKEACVLFKALGDDVNPYANFIVGDSAIAVVAGASGVEKKLKIDREAVVAGASGDDKIDGEAVVAGGDVKKLKIDERIDWKSEVVETLFMKVVKACGEGNVTVKGIYDLMAQEVEGEGFTQNKVGYHLKDLRKSSGKSSKR